MFSVLLSPKAPGPSVVQAAGAEGDPASQPRHVLPKDLAGALKRLDNSEIDTLLSAVTTEAEHRGRLPKPQPQLEAKPAAQRTAVGEVASGLTKGKLNAVRAAFKAGVKPSAIARQFGISQSDVRKALARGPDRGP
jgi:DNA invertase Pin-like site-specific DNA recombinase